MTQAGIHVPGPGLVRARAWAGRSPRRSPRRWRCTRQGSEASGLDLKRLCFEGTAEELTRTDLQQPALVATSLAIDAALRARGIEPDYVVGHSVGEFSALGSAHAIERARHDPPRPRARPRDGRRRQGDARARWPRSSASPTRSSSRSARRSTTCGRRTTTARASSSSPVRPTRSTSAARRPSARAPAAPCGSRSRARSTRRSSSAPPSASARRSSSIDFKAPTAHFVSTVTAKLEDATRLRTLLVEQLTAPVKFTQSAREMIGGGVTTFVEVGPGNVLSGLLKRIDSSVKAISVNDLKSLDAAAHQLG